MDPRIEQLIGLRAGQPDVFRALSPEPTEIAALARAAGAQLPDGYRDVLRHVGCGELKFGVLFGPDPTGEYAAWVEGDAFVIANNGVGDYYVVLRDGDVYGEEVHFADHETGFETTPTGFGIVDFVARHCFRHVHAFVDLAEVSDERALLTTVGHALFGTQETITRWDAVEKSLRSLVLHNDAVTLEVVGWEAARERIGPRADFLPEVCAETGATFEPR
jgi:hypothetical protein